MAQPSETEHTLGGSAVELTGSDVHATGKKLIEKFEAALAQIPEFIEVNDGEVDPPQSVAQMLIERYRDVSPQQSTHNPVESGSDLLRNTDTTFNIGDEEFTVESTSSRRFVGQREFRVTRRIDPDYYEDILIVLQTSANYGTIVYDNSEDVRSVNDSLAVFHANRMLASLQTHKQPF